MDTKVLKELQELLKGADLTIAWAARRIGMSDAYLGMIIKGGKVPSNEVKLRIVSLRDRLKKSGLSEAS